jgi:hypothetical protein
MNRALPAFAIKQNYEVEHLQGNIVDTCHFMCTSLDNGRIVWHTLTGIRLWAQICAHLNFELRTSLITFRIFVRCQRLIARNVADGFLLFSLADTFIQSLLDR